jgi:hypothetical protein
MVCQWFGLTTTGTVYQWFDLKTGGDGFSRVGLKIGGDGFSRFDLKTGGEFFCLSLKTKVVEDFLIWASKSPRQFLGLDLKTKQATICWLCHKIDGRAITWDTRRDLAACFT